MVRSALVLHAVKVQCVLYVMTSFLRRTDQNLPLIGALRFIRTPQYIAQLHLASRPALQGVLMK